MKLTNELSNQIIEEINNIDEKNKLFEAIEILKKYSKYELKGAQLGRAFEKMFVGKNGFSPDISMEELEKYHHSFHTTNGGDWCRTNQSYLGKKYNLVRTTKGGRIFSVKCDGLNKNIKIKQDIRIDISKEIKKRKCVILDISTNTECDHKDGMKDDWRLNDKSRQKLDDFQPLCKTANDAKRSHCKKCKEIGKRYDATRLGYSTSYTFGTSTSKTCVGCYWYDPYAFNKEISKGFIKYD
mgnify:FL=1